ncbi:Uma2 family endonuclease [Dyadobacter sp. CY356]|uniref:Uma2 family endonuclease n=1 Tax=Dyadobacter sp. CY356 TaxID=2906442 RepID=UPI001F3F094E|nr:Uma2 family endonuclease [Dyadobacter sp. CY356]MCF0059823.1 Uma2 family endonuclease [Dyadobacter sp. CY356]
MITNLDQLDLNETYSYADYLKWQFEERVELIKGKIFKMSPAPARRHQRISSRFQGELYSFLNNETCQVYAAPFDVGLTPRKSDNTNKIYTVVQPDICVICDSAKLDEKGCIGAPDWIIEILSPGNSQVEMKNKFEVYQDNGVKEYWIAEPTTETIFVYILNEEGKYIGLHPFTTADVITSHIFPDFELSVADIFKD